MALGKYAVDYEERVHYNRLRTQRLERAKKHLNKDGLGALITWDEANIRYLTSYYVTTPMRASETQCVFIPRNGEPILFCGGTTKETERRMPWMKERVFPGMSQFKFLAKNPDDPSVAGFVARIAKLMADYGVEKETLGIDGSTCGLLLDRAFKKAGITTVHGKPTMDAARMKK